MEQESGMTEMKGSGWPGSTLKLIAVVTMLMDHFGAVFLERVLEAERISVDLNDGWNMPGLAKLYLFLRLAGRVAFPIFIFLLVEGFSHTRNRWKYLGRLFLFALISEAPFDMALQLTDEQIFSGVLLESSYQNVFFTLAIGLLTIMVLDQLKGMAGHRAAKALVCLFVVGAGMALAELFRTDYGAVGVLAIVAMYCFRNYRMLGMGATCMVLMLSSTLEVTAFLALLPVSRYNGVRGLKLKYLFYAFYPLHLLFLWGLCIFMGYMR
jgi:hypothetical protein